MNKNLFILDLTKLKENVSFNIYKQLFLKSTVVDKKLLIPSIERVHEAISGITWSSLLKSPAAKSVWRKGYFLASAAAWGTGGPGWRR